MTKKETKKIDKPFILLKFKKGDQIIKEGDYGISIYKVISGKVQVTIESEGKELVLATLGRGEIIGEMILLDRSAERRSASVKALEDSELEVWHPQTIAKEYEDMPPILNYIADQALNHLIRMNRFIAMLNDKKKLIEEKKGVDPWAAKREFYRKEVNLPFSFRPVSSQSHRDLTGIIRDISLSGAGLEVSTINTPSHKVGDKFIINTTLPNDKKLMVAVKLVSIDKGKTPGTQYWGVSFIELTEHIRKILHFFLMP